MNEVQKNLWPGWETVRLIGRGSYGAVYEIQRDFFGNIEKAALKVISVPQYDSNIDEMYSDGYDKEEIVRAFESALRSIVAECAQMQKMRGSSNVVNYDDVRWVRHDDGIGWDIFIKMELLTPLAQTLSNDVSEETVVQIAKDMCTALVLCKKHEIIHRNIEPENVFVSPHGDYKLGDFRISRKINEIFPDPNLLDFGIINIGAEKYMAPEEYHCKPFGHAANIYSLGLVLYWLLNEQRIPFLPPECEKLKVVEAIHRRFSGEKLPQPAHGSAALKRIVLKACAYDPQKRYQTAAEMLKDIEKHFRRTCET